MAIAVVGVELVGGQVLKVNSLNGYYYNKFRHWPKEENGTCGDGGTTTVVCPRDYDCYVAPVYNRPFFCWDPRFDPNADPMEEMTRARNRTMAHFNDTLQPLLADIRHAFTSSGINDTFTAQANAIRALSEQVATLTEELQLLRIKEGGGLVSWIVMVAPSLLIFFAIIFGYVWYRRLRWLRSKDTKRLKDSIDKLTLANYLGVEPRDELLVERQGLPPRRVVSPSDSGRGVKRRVTFQDPRPIITQGGQQLRQRGHSSSIRISPGSDRFNHLASGLGQAIGQYQRQQGAVGQQRVVGYENEVNTPSPALPSPPMQQRGALDFGFPLARGEERGQSEPPVFTTSMQSLYENNRRMDNGPSTSNDNISFFRRVNSAGRLPPRRPPPPVPSIQPFVGEEQRRKKMFGDEKDFSVDTTAVYNPVVVKPEQSANYGAGTQSTNV